MMIEGAQDGLPPLPNGERVAGAKRKSGEGVEIFPSRQAKIVSKTARRSALA